MTNYTYRDTDLVDFFRIEGYGHSIELTDSARFGLLDIRHTSGTGDPAKTSVDVELYDTSRIDLLRVTNLDMYLTMEQSSRARMIQHSEGLARIDTAGGYIAFIETWRSDSVIKMDESNIGFLSLGSDTGNFKHKITVSGSIGYLDVALDQTVLTVAAGHVSGATLGDSRDIVRVGAGSINVIETGGGSDKIFNSGSINMLNAGAGNDVVLLRGYMDLTDLGSGNDVLVIRGGNAGFSLLRGGAGNDTIDARKATAGVYIENEGGEFFATRGVEVYYGSSHNDTITGGRGTNAIYGRKGGDHLDGGAGNDKLEGGTGNDVMDGGDGNDTINGGKGRDIFFGSSGSDTYIFREGDGNDKFLSYQQGIDTIIIESEDFDSLDIRVSGADLFVGYIGGSILLVGHEATILTGGDFIFT